MLRYTAIFLFLFFSGPAIAQEKSTVELLQKLWSIHDQFQKHLNEKDLSALFNYDATINEVTPQFFQTAFFFDPQSSTQGRAILNDIAELLRQIRVSALNGNGQDASAGLLKLKSSLLKLQQCYPPELQEKIVAASKGKFSCRSHPDITGSRGENCKTCGRFLENIDPMCGALIRQNLVSASLLSGALKTNRVNQILFQLKRQDSSPLLAKDLLLVHQSPMHVFIIDGTLTDYHHIHPAFASTPGQFEFQFTPQKPGAYKMWVDILPSFSRRQELLLLELPSTNTPSGAIEKSLNVEAQSTSMKYELTFSSRSLRPMLPIFGKLSVKDLTGQPITSLEPLMGAFAHIAAFHEDGKTLLHIHPSGDEITDPAARGGPNLDFYLSSPKPGFYRFFAQVKLHGQIETATFGVLVNP